MPGQQQFYLWRAQRHACDDKAEGVADKTESFE